MVERIMKSNWLRYLIEALTMTFVLGLLGGVVVGFLRGWKYASKGFFLPTVDTLNLSINETLFIAFLFILLFLLVFLALQYVIRNIRWACFIAGAVSCLPLFLFWGYRINRVYLVRFFELDGIIWYLVIGIELILLWILVSIGLFFWTRLRILKTSAVNIKGLGALLAVVLVLNISMSLFHKLHPTNNVIILLIDALRADRLGCYGYSRNTTPNIDKFSKDAVIFTQAISQATFTKTSIASLFTSLYPYQHGVYESGRDDTKDNITSDILGEEETTLAEALLQNGFLTTACLNQPYLRSYFGFAQGFVEYDEKGGGIESINKKFTKWISRIGKGNKFFAYIHYLDLHEPYLPKPPYDIMYGVYSDLYSRIDVKKWYSFLDATRKNKIKLEKKDVDQLIAYNDGQLTYIDSQIGLLLEELKKEGLYDNTLIVLTADHGDGFMEHGFISHSTTPYDELLRVPLIIKFPKSLYAGRVVKSQVRLIDVMPTVLDFLGIRINKKLEGLSLLNYLNDNKDNKIHFPKYAISEIAKNIHNLVSSPMVSIRTERFKYIDFPEKEDEFYDLSADPKEQNNIIHLRRDEAEKFHKIALSIALERKKKKEVEKVTLDKKTIEELKALGYIQ